MTVTVTHLQAGTDSPDHWRQQATPSQASESSPSHSATVTGTDSPDPQVVGYFTGKFQLASEGAAAGWEPEDFPVLFRLVAPGRLRLSHGR